MRVQELQWLEQNRGQCTAMYRGQCTAMYRDQCTVMYRDQGTAMYRSQCTTMYRDQCSAMDSGRTCLYRFNQINICPHLCLRRFCSSKTNDLKMILAATWPEAQHYWNYGKDK